MLDCSKALMLSDAKACLWCEGACGRGGGFNIVLSSTLLVVLLILRKRC